HLDAVLKDVGAIDAIGGEWSIERQLIRLDTIGKGGGGQVYRAIDMRDGQEVAVKEVSIAAYSEEVRRQIVESVRNEYAVAVALPKNSGIANVRGLLSDPDGTLYLVQDLIKGTSLAKLYTPEPAPARLLPLLVDVADALATLHANHIVHRDLKPDNVMVRRGSARDEAVLIDFGIALLDGQPDTLKFYGTAGYMAPEQARGEKADARADIYSLGKMIAQVWGSDEPPVAASKLAILWRGEGQSAMPEPLAGIVRQMLASDREKRPELGIVRSALEGCQASKA
ncbi:MAG TPA: serine/threonine-protein kinase, partial [Methyloceanibacter sp.]|nr:serine/threonine-protein kinase [Methyloceanibacter sp.]